MVWRVEKIRSSPDNAKRALITAREEAPYAPNLICRLDSLAEIELDEDETQALVGSLNVGDLLEHPLDWRCEVKVTCRHSNVEPQSGKCRSCGWHGAPPHRTRETWAGDIRIRYREDRRVIPKG